MPSKNAVVLLSGGLDSSTAAAIAQKEGYRLYALTFRYGQRHEKEIEAAKKVATFLNVKDHLIIDFNLRAIGGSALTDQLEVPKGRSPEKIAHGIQYIFFRTNHLDYSGYPDCREEYIRAFEQMANLDTKAGVEGKLKTKIRTPLTEMTKAEIIKKGLELGVDYSLTWSCYDPTPDGLACGLCDSCQLRLKGFKEAGSKDPMRYAG
jgi:7-cyano-7-deazaguanine synthase